MKRGLLFLFFIGWANYSFSQNNPQEENKNISVLALLCESFDSCDLEWAGANVKTRIGDIITIQIEQKSLTQLNNIASIKYWQKANKVKPNLEKAITDIRADSVQQGIDLPNGFAGEDVIIGITDWGFDYTHPMFYDTALKQTRILAAWDQYKKSGPAPSGYDYGTEFEGESQLLAAGSDTSNVYNYGTHGSHVAGIAGGSGGGTKYRGIAYKANFLFATFLVNEAAFIDAVAWMQQKAKSYNKRLVVNMSWGLYNLGTMDGNSLLSRALDEFSAQGVVFIASGGNNGGVDFHIKKEFKKDTLNTKVNFYNYNANANMYGQCITMWGEKGKTFSSYFGVYDASRTMLSKSPIFTTNDPIKSHSGYVVSGIDTVFYKLVLDDNHPLNERNYLRMKIKNTNTDLSIGLHSFADSGLVHYWNVVELTNDVGNWGLPFTKLLPTWTTGDDKYGVGEPACTKSVITVAAHSSESIAPNGTLVGGRITNFSSQGPTLDERVKPDVSAPGSQVISSISSFADGSYPPTTTTDFNGRTYTFSPFSGTSMSSPATAGVAALVLNANPYLTSAQVKEIIMITAREDKRTGSVKDTGSFTWGYGKVSAWSAIKLALETETVKPNEDNFVYPNPTSKFLFYNNRDKTNWKGTVYSSDGRLVLTGKLNTQSGLPIGSLRPGLYFVEIDGLRFKFIVK